jgi:hypothetical protein
MKGRTFPTAALLLGLAACAAPLETVLHPSGPIPDAGTGNVPRETDERGLLRVSTPTVRVDQKGRPFDLPHDLDWDSSHAVPTGYAVYDRDGRRVAEVPNHSPLVVTDEGPADVALPAGRYRVRLDRPDGGARTFWVTIERGRRTEVDPARLGGGEPEAR